MKERLQKIIAKAGIASRRGAEELIRRGKVKVDGKTITELGVQADPDKQKITFEGKPVVIHERKVYLLLNKPKGYVTTLQDTHGRPIVSELLPRLKERLFPVGRLDLDTEGALLMTNDGELSQRLLHPSYEINRTYEAKVTGHPPKAKLNQLAQGIELEGKKTSPAKLKTLRKTPKATTIQIIIHEGRKRQVRKMFAAIGHRVIELKRTAYGRLKLGSLPSGKYRFLSEKDLKRIFS